MLIDITKGAEHVYIACGSTDFRKQIDGLCALVQLQFRLDPFSPTCVFLFCNKKPTGIKALRFESDGFLLATKRLVGDMKFQWPKDSDEVRDISSQQVRWLCEGLSVEQKTALKPVAIFPEKSCF